MRTRTTRSVFLGIGVSLAVVGLIVPVRALTQPAAASSLVEVTDFGSNPGNLRMHVYVPTSVQAEPGIVVAMHGCNGDGPGYFQYSGFASLADRYGFIVIYPSASKNSNCFDGWSDAAKHRGGGSDPVSIMSMVTYVEQRYNGDPDRVFSAGMSSGAVQTNFMLALYPDVFAAGAVFAGTPFACFPNEADYEPGASQCAGGNILKTPEEWGDLVRQAYPGYTGEYPPIQLWHGTADTLINITLLQEEIDQWTNVNGLSLTPDSTDTSQLGRTRQRWLDSSGAVQIEAIAVAGAGHILPPAVIEAEAIAFFGLDRPAPLPAPIPEPLPALPPATPPTTVPTVPGACAATYRTVMPWFGGFQGEVTVAAGASAVNGWTVHMTLAGGQGISSLWNGVSTGSSGAISVNNAPYNSSLGAGASTTFGFIASGNDSVAPSAVSCTSP